MRNQNNQTKSAEQETELAHRYGGHLVKQSGAGHEKGDVCVPGKMRIEAKRTKHSGYRVTRDALFDIEEAAAMSGEMPVIIVGLEDEIETFAVLPIEEFKKLLGKSSD